MSCRGSLLFPSRVNGEEWGGWSNWGGTNLALRSNTRARKILQKMHARHLGRFSIRVDQPPELAEAETNRSLKC